jgi:citrate lyase subunit beta/citryl-CoA lyase
MRSLLFVPGDSARKLEKGLAAGADALIIDLEDSVAASGKDEARRVTAGFLREAGTAAERPLLYVRVNGLATGQADADLDGIMPGRPDGIVLPKAVGGRDAQHLGAKLAVREAGCGHPDGVTRILPIATETAAGVFALGTFAGSSPRLSGLTWGGEDLSADLGAEANRGPDGAYTEPYRLARALTLLGAAAAEVDAVDTVYTNFRDLDGLAAECRDARRDGFVAKMAIHPAQVAVIN